MVSKIDSRSSELVEMLVGKEHLAEHFKMTQPPPWLLYSLDMLRFSN
jgi:hypothetical protein